MAAPMSWITVDMKTSGAPAPGTLLILDVHPESPALAPVDTLAPKLKSAPTPMHCLVIESELLLNPILCQLEVYVVRTLACGPLPSPDDSSMIPLPVQDGLSIPQPPTPRQFGRPLEVTRNCPGVDGQYWVVIATQPLKFDLELYTKFQETATDVALPPAQLCRLLQYAGRLAACEPVSSSSYASPGTPSDASTDLLSDGNSNEDESDDSDSEWEVRSEGVLETLRWNATLPSQERGIGSKIKDWRTHIPKPNLEGTHSTTSDIPTLSNTGECEGKITLSCT